MKLFIFGSTGDLVKRKILPSLESMPIKNLEIYAIGRRDLNTKSYLDLACEKCSPEFKKKIRYIQIDYNKDNFLEKFLEYLDKKEINYFYVALPPQMYKQILEKLAELKQKRIIIRILLEKPFGSNLKEAKELASLINKKNLNEEIFLSDHYLFKKEIRNLKEREFKKLEIRSLEKIGLEGRVNFYDEIGALKDMIQSHLMNILFKLVKTSELKNYTIEYYFRAQYGDGKSKGYIKDLGKDSETETFAYLVLRTKDKEIILATGKALDEKIISINIDEQLIIVKDDKSYENLLNDFFAGKKDDFPDINDAILSWEIIEKALTIKSKLGYYNKGDSLQQVLSKLTKKL